MKIRTRMGRAGGRRGGREKTGRRGGGNCAAVKFLAKILSGSRPRNVKIVKETRSPANAMSK